MSEALNVTAAAAAVMTAMLSTGVTKVVIERPIIARCTLVLLLLLAVVLVLHQHLLLMLR
jgi:hypothetical protein